MPKLTSYYDYIVVVEADFGSALKSTDQVGFWKFDPDFCPNYYEPSNFQVMSVGHSQVGVRKLTIIYGWKSYSNFFGLELVK